VAVRAGAALSPRALVTGVGGQDGSYLAELLLDRGYDVVGVVRVGPGDAPNLAAVAGRIELVEADLLDGDAFEELLRAHAPDELYNLAAPTFVPRSWERPIETAELVAVGVATLLEAVRLTRPSLRLFQASSGEIFGEATVRPQIETTRVAPVTPYGAAKAYAHLLVGAYRRRYGLHASCGILYNHESPRRPRGFLPSKVAHGAAAVSLGVAEELVLGDLDAERDWGYAPDYVDAMWRILQEDEPDDYVVATGEVHSVQALVEAAFAHLGLDWREHVRVDDALKRGAAELHQLVGDASKARARLDWKPSVTFEELVALLVDAALEDAR